MKKLLGSLILTLAATSPALAAEQQTLSRDRPAADFQGKKGVGWNYGGVTAFALGTGCHASGLNCETTLVRLDDSGRFSAFADDASLPAYATLQLLLTRIYEADAQGRPARLVAQKSGGPAVVSNAKAGMYVVVVQWLQGNWDYVGRLRLGTR